ncbi:MAG: nucleoside recognition domain-containing protein [Verrucomicrobiota bacterium]
MKNDAPRVLAVGMESVGKTRLLSTLSGNSPKSENFKGSTLTCESYYTDSVIWIDSPGLCRDSETEAMEATLQALDQSEKILLVIRADRAEKQLESLLPMVEGRTGFMVLTFSDRFSKDVDKAKMVADFETALGIPVLAADARNLSDHCKDSIVEMAQREPGSTFQNTPIDQLVKKYPANPPTVTAFQNFVSHPLAAIFLLLLPAIVAVILANGLADSLYDTVNNAISPIRERINQWPALLTALFAGDYGLISMLPFLLLYALPTTLAFSAILAVYKSTGLIDRLSVALHPWLRPIGIGGRELVRVVMGFGCNVPAVIASRSCSSCSRGTCVSAISFGSACSYQLPATLAVFGAAGMPWLGVVYIAVLAITTLIYLRFTTPKALRLASNQLLLPESDPLQKPSIKGVLQEVWDDFRQFLVMSLPIFVAICFGAALLSFLGVFGLLSKLLTPLMAAFRLPGDAATAVVLGSIRKDGIAIGILDSDWGSLKLGLETPSQVLTAVYLAGVLLPCIVTLFTMARELHWSFAVKTCLRQMAWASGFSLVIAWIGALIW